MEDEIRLPIFRGDGSEDPDQHWFLCEAIWNIKNVTDEVVKRTKFIVSITMNRSFNTITLIIPLLKLSQYIAQIFSFSSPCLFMDLFLEIDFG